MKNYVEPYELLEENIKKETDPWILRDIYRENKGKIAKKNSGGSKKDKKKASDEIERYHEETRTL